MVVAVNIVIISSERAYSQKRRFADDSILTSSRTSKIDLQAQVLCNQAQDIDTVGHPEYSRIPR